MRRLQSEGHFAAGTEVTQMKENVVRMLKIWKQFKKIKGLKIKFHTQQRIYILFQAYKKHL